MRLLTYNFLTSKAIKGVTVGYPLKLHIKKQETVQSEFNSEFITRMIPRLHWPAICLASESVGMSSDIPKELGDNIASDQELLQKLHHLLLEIDIIEGHLECPETGRIFPIADGIPNMLLNEDEV